MNEYYNSLDKETKSRYLTKLECIRLSLFDHPYSSQNDGKFSQEMSTWPSIEYGHIFAYYINKPGTYTQEELLSWKQLEACNYFQSGYVRTIMSRRFGSGGGRYVMMKALVNPSQKALDKANQA